MESHEGRQQDGRSKVASEILARDEEHLIPVYARYPVVMERGEGCFLFDVDGNRYLDMMGGLGVNALGHGHPRMVAAMVEQAGSMVHLSPQYSNRWPSLLAQKLAKLTGMPGVFFSTGGSEAVEGALKLARTHGRQASQNMPAGVAEAWDGGAAWVLPWADVRVAFGNRAG